MFEHDQQAGNDNGPRLEDVGRRSACDRCRGMKMRCERPHREQFIAQLQQCRRCEHARAQCITTLVAEQYRYNAGKHSRQQPTSRKRRGQPSTEVNPKSPVPDQNKPLELDTAGLVNQTDGATNETTPWSSIPVAFGPQSGVSTSQDTDFQQSDLDHIMGMNMDAGSIALSEQDHPMSIDSSSDDNTAISFARYGHHDSEATAQAMCPTFPNAPLNCHFDASFYEDSLLHWSTLPGVFGQGLPETPREMRRTITGKLMDFNTRVSQELHDLKKMNNAHRENSSTILLRTLQRSDSFTKLLETFTSPGDLPSGGSSPPSSSSSSSEAGSGSTNGWGEKVEIDIALLLLSCNTNVSSMYELLCGELLTRPDWQLKESESQASLAALHLGGLQSLTVEMRLQVLMHVCLLKFIGIQKELASMGRLGLLTQRADDAFQVVLGRSGWTGQGGNPEWPALFVERIMHGLRRVVGEERRSD